MDEAATAAAQARELQRRQAAGEGPEARPMTTSTIHMSVDLLNALRSAANRRADRKMREDPRGRGDDQACRKLCAFPGPAAEFSQDHGRNGGAYLDRPFQADQFGPLRDDGGDV
jgi:hypothetical protein